MNCPNCNSKINPGENFCRICGTKIVTQNPVNQNTVTNSDLTNQTQNMDQGVPNHQIQSNSNVQNQNMSTQQQGNIFINPIPQQPNANETANGNKNDSLLSLMQPQSSTNNSTIGTPPNQNMNNQFQNNNQNQSMYQIQPETNYTQQPYYQQPGNYQQQVIKIGINTEALIDAYIGENVDQIRNRTFSFCTFFFVISYMIYRKMWLLAVLYFVVTTIASLFLSWIGSIILFVARIFVSVKFKDMYMNHVKEQVEKIKRENPEKNQEQLLSICRKQGGTSLLAVILVELISLALLSITTYLEYRSEYSNESIDENTGLVGELNVEIPSNFEEIAHVSSSFAMYSLTEETDTCTLNITNNKYFNGKTIEEYIEDEIEYKENDIVIVSEYRVINGNKWYYLEIQRPATTEPIDGNYSIKSIDYYYVTQKNNEIYEVEFLTYLDNTGACYRARSTIENSLRFE